MLYFAKRRIKIRSEADKIYLILANSINMLGGVWGGGGKVNKFEIVSNSK